MRHSDIYNPTYIRPPAATAKLEQLRQQLDNGAAPPERAPDIAQTVQSIVRDCGDPADILELFYWTKQPGLRAAVRVLASLPVEKRAVIQTFLTLATNPDAIEVNLNESGELRLYSQDVAANLSAFRNALT